MLSTHRPPERPSTADRSPRPQYALLIGCLAFLVLLLGFAAGISRAETTVLDFENLPAEYQNNGTRLGSYYSAKSLSPSFSLNTNILNTAYYNLNSSEFPPHSGTAVLNQTSGSSVEITFATGGAAFAGFFYRTSESLTLTAYDAGDQQIATASSTGPDLAPNPEKFLSVTSATANIRKLVITGTSGYYTADDITYQVDPQPALTVLGPDGKVVHPSDSITSSASADKTLTFTIANYGGGALTGVDVTFSGTNTSDLTLTQAAASEIATGGSSTFSVRFKPSSIQARTATIHIASNDPTNPGYDIDVQYSGAPGITSDSSVFAELNQPFSYQITANNSAYSYYVTGLPYGLSYNSTSGLISGTPYYASSYSVYIYAYGYPSVSGYITITVQQLTPQIDYANPPAATQGQMYSFQVTASNSPTHFEASNLPEGLKIDPDTGLISGTPTGFGYYYATVNASNSHGVGPANYLYFQVIPVVPVIYEAQVFYAYLKEAADLELGIQNSVTTLTAEGLPPGLRIDPTTKHIVGKPTKTGYFETSFTATNEFGSSAATVGFNVFDNLSDNFAARTPVSGLHVHLRVTNAFASREAGEPDHAHTSGISSIWCTWKAPLSGQFYLSTDTSALLAVYQGKTLITLHEVVSNVDNGNGRPFGVYFQAIEGQEYHIAIDSSAGDGYSIEGEVDLDYIGQRQSSLLSVSSTGGGAITPGFLGGSYRLLGQEVTISATPAPGYFFTGWGGSLSSAARTLKFRMQPDMSLTATFTQSPFFAFRGEYRGLLNAGENTSFSNLGTVTINLSGYGYFSAEITLAGRSYRLKGAINPDSLEFHGFILRDNAYPLAVNLYFSSDEYGASIGASVGDDLTTSTGILRHVVSDSDADPSLQSGYHTVTFAQSGFSGDAGPLGTGYGGVTIANNGTLRFVGSANDGTPVAQGTRLVVADRWLFFANAGLHRGALSGEIILDSTNTPPITGSAAWYKVPTPGAKLYPGPFVATLDVMGSRYVPPADGVRVIALENLPQNAQVNFAAYYADSDALWESQSLVTLSRANRLVLAPVAPGSLFATPGTILQFFFDPNSGYFSGKIIGPDSNRPVVFRGAFVQGLQSGFGLLRLPDRVGSVSIRPNEDY